MSDSPKLVIGLTGLPSSGKGEVAAALIEAARRRGWLAEHLSFSDRIKDEARRRGTADAEFTRELLSQIGIEMREAEGPGVLASRLVAMIEAWPSPVPEMFVVEALRHVGEIATLREAFGKRFTLIAVESDPRTIARRLIARRRPDESAEALQSEEKAVELLEAELHGRQSPLGPNVGQCFEQADIRLDNNGTLDRLRQDVRRVFGDLQSADCPSPQA